MTIQEKVASELDRMFVPWDKNLSLPNSEIDSGSLHDDDVDVFNMSNISLGEVNNSNKSKRRSKSKNRSQSKVSRSEV